MASRIHSSESRIHSSNIIDVKDINNNINLLVKDSHGNTPLHIYVINNRIDVMKALFGNPVMKQLCNVQNKYGNTPLHVSKNDTVTRLLLDNGASPFIANNKGIIPYICNKDIKAIVDSKFFIS